MTNEDKYKPISVQEAIDIITRTPFLQSYAISDIKALIDALKNVELPYIFFLNCKVSECKCVEMEFRRQLSFQECIFEKDAYFCGRTVFAEQISFLNVTFEKDAHFNPTIFEKDATFENCIFKQCAYFNGAEINSRLDFRNSEFVTKLNLSNLNLRPGGQILLALDQIGKHQRPSWFDGWLAKINFVHRQWPSVHLIDGEDSKHKNERKSAADQYNLLRDNLRGLPSKDDEEDRCHYKYKDLTRRATKGHHLWRLWDWAVMKWCLGYGIYTKRILFTAGGVIFLFAILYYFTAGPELIKNYDCKFCSLYFSVITFTTIGYGDYAPMGWLRFFAGLEGLLGLILIAVFTVSFARKLIR